MNTNPKVQLNQLRTEFSLIQSTSCSQNENMQFEKLLQENQKLPKGVIKTLDGFGDPAFSHVENNFNYDEKIEYIMLQNLRYTRTMFGLVGLLRR